MSGMKVAGGNNVALTEAISVVATIEKSVLCTREISNVGPHKAHLFEALVKTMQALPYQDKPCSGKRFDAWASRASA